MTRPAPSASRAVRPAGAGAITDVAGVEVGHFTDDRRPTGCSVVIVREGAVAGVDVRGAAPGTRETDLLAPHQRGRSGPRHSAVRRQRVGAGCRRGRDALAGRTRHRLSGGGRWRVPIVPGAVLFDLMVGDPSIRPGADSGYRACELASSRAPAQGNVGAGTGASIGKIFGMARAMRGGIGHRIGDDRRRDGGGAGGLQCAGRRHRSGHRPDRPAGARTPDGKSLLDSRRRPAARPMRSRRSSPAPTPPSA